jgi:endonuclease/exonuclease/phosphatase family metal-dependent hydrolase
VPIVAPPRPFSDLVRWVPLTARPDLVRWSAAVGPPAVYPMPRGPIIGVPELRDLVLISWNVHEANGRIDALLDDLNTGRLTGSRPKHVILILQEAYRAGTEVPPFPRGAKTPHIIGSRSPQPDVVEIARRRGLAYAYVPSIRNGRYPREDRGCAILSSLPLEDVTAYELVHERQRRVTVGATVHMSVSGSHRRVRVFSLQLDTNGVFDPLGHAIHRKQIDALLPDLGCGPGDDSDCVLGGDFNSFFGGNERAVAATRKWFGASDESDGRRTQIMGRLDHMFCHIPRADWAPHTRRLNGRYGSDHYPLITTAS